jgi:hypothetical protein
MVPSAGQKIPLVKKGFFRQVRELKIQRKNPGSALCLYIYIQTMVLKKSKSWVQICNCQSLSSV